MKKRYIFLAILVLIIAGVYFFAPSLESIVQKVVHKYGSEITGTDVNLKGFNLTLTTGEGRINEITVANPTGYKSKNIFELGEIYVKVDIKSLTTDTIIIDSIEVTKPIITYEMFSLTRNNIADIQANIKKNTASVAKQEVEAKNKPASTPGEKAEISSKKVIIKNLIIKEGEVNAVASKENISVKLPVIQMTNIGGNNGGEPVSVTISKVLSKILNTASTTVINSKISDLRGVAEGNLNEVVGGVKDRVKNIGIFGK